MAMGHVILKEFFVDRAGAVLHRLRQAATPTCRSWSRLERARRRRTSPGKFLTAADLGRAPARSAAFKTVLLDAATGEPVVPERLAGLPVRRRRRGQVEPRPRRRRPAADAATAAAPRRAEVAAAPLRRPPDGAGGVLRRGVPVRRVGGQLVTTVFDLLLAQYGVGRAGPAGRAGRPATTTPTQPYTPAWQEAITGVPAPAAARIGREFAAQRRGVRRPLDDHHGRRAPTTGSTPTRSTARS